MKVLDGVKYVKSDKCSVFWISEFTEELKSAIREQLAEICHGVNFAKSGHITYNYINTVKEFLKRFETKSEKTKIGMLGELLLHLIIHCYFDEYKSVTPFFNMEERSIKKGYDAVLTEVANPTLWIIEVKSGKKHAYKNSDQTINDLIDLANNDLKVRLNDDNTTLWLEAINGAQISFDNNSSMKPAVIDILQDWSDTTVNGTYSSDDKNVILTGVLFSGLSEMITMDNANKQHSLVENANTFNKLYVIAIQKETYEKLYDFLKKEAACAK